MFMLDISSPESLDEALELKKNHGNEIQVLAGGTDVLINITKGAESVHRSAILNLTKIEELHFVRETTDTIEIGPLVTHSEIIHNQLIQAHIPSLCKAASFIGSPQIRNQGFSLIRMTS